MSGSGATVSQLGNFCDPVSQLVVNPSAPTPFLHPEEVKMPPMIEDMTSVTPYSSTVSATTLGTAGGSSIFRVPYNQAAYVGACVLELGVTMAATVAANVCMDQFAAFNYVSAYEWRYNNVPFYSGTGLDLKLRWANWSDTRKTDEAYRIGGPINILDRIIDANAARTYYVQIPTPWDERSWPLEQVLANDLELVITYPNSLNLVQAVVATGAATAPVTFNTQRLWYKYFHVPASERALNQQRGMVVDGQRAGILRPLRMYKIATSSQSLATGTANYDVSLRGFPYHVDEIACIIRIGSDLTAGNYHAHAYRGDRLDGSIVVNSISLIESNGNVIRSALAADLRKSRHSETHMSSSNINIFWFAIGLNPENEKQYTGGLPLTQYTEPTIRFNLTITGGPITAQIDCALHTINFLQVANGAIRQLYQ